MYKNIQNSIPWLILAGSGGVADILVTLMDRGCWDADMVQELLINIFPNDLHSTEITSWVKLVMDNWLLVSFFYTTYSYFLCKVSDFVY